MSIFFKQLWSILEFDVLNQHHCDISLMVIFRPTTLHLQDHWRGKYHGFIPTLLKKMASLTDQNLSVRAIHTVAVYHHNHYSFYRKAKRSWWFWSSIWQSCFPLLLVIRSITDVLRAQSRFVKFVGGGGAGRTPTHFTNPLCVRSTSVTDFITNLSRR